MVGVESALEVNTALELALLIPTAPQTHPPRPLLHHAAAPIPAFLCAPLVVARLVRSPALLRRPVSTLAHSQPLSPSSTASSLYEMTGVRANPVQRRKKVVKRKTKFIRFQSDRYVRVKSSWRIPHGIDCRMRRRFRGTRPLVNIGYGTDSKTRHLLPNGLYKFRVSNVKDLEMLIMSNRKFAAEICHNVSARGRKEIVERAEQLRIVVTNAGSKLKAEENE